MVLVAPNCRKNGWLETGNTRIATGLNHPQPFNELKYIYINLRGKQKQARSARSVSARLFTHWVFHLVMLCGTKCCKVAILDTLLTTVCCIFGVPHTLSNSHFVRRVELGPAYWLAFVISNLQMKEAKLRVKDEIS